MRLYRIGDKVVSREKLTRIVGDILAERERGATQEEAAHAHGVQRTFVSFLESLGEIRRGPKVALVAFPVANADEVRSLAEEKALDLTVVLSQTEREGLESAPAAKLFNQVLEVLAQLRDFDVIVLLASDWRIRTVEKILGREVVGIPLGHSPLRRDVEVDLEELSALLETVIAEAAQPGAHRGRDSAETASNAPRRWDLSSK